MVSEQVMIKTGDDGALKYNQYHNIDDDVQKEAHDEMADKNLSQRLFAVVKKGWSEEKNKWQRVVIKRKQKKTNK